MDMTSEGVARAVFDRMAAKQCDEEAATQYVFQRIGRSPELLKELWTEEGRRVIHRWAGDMLRGFNGTGPRPCTAPANYGTSRRKQYHAGTSYLDCLIKVNGKIKVIGALEGEDLDTLVNEYEGIAARNQYHAEEMRHIRSFVADGTTLAACASKLDSRADTYLKAFARIEEEKAEEAAA